MSELQLMPGQILSAELARHLPVWRLETFARDNQFAPTRRPQTEAEKRAIQAALQKAQQDETRRLAAAQLAAQAALLPPVPETPPEPLVDLAEIERIKTAAFDEGYAAGYDQGGSAAKREAQKLRALAEASASTFSRFETDLAPQLLNLALEIARQVVRRELSTDSNLVLAVVREAFNQLTGGETGRQLLLNPADVQLVRAHLGDELDLGQWKVIEDSNIEPGGCRISTSQSELDATVQTRWQRTIATVGSSASWKDADA